MKIRPKFIQVNCEETKKLDLRQANVVKNLKPDIIILEYPNSNPTPSLVFNNYPPLEKPKDLVKKRTSEFSKEVLRVNPWVKADTIMWKNVANLWKADHQVMVFAVDAPNELTNEWFEVWLKMYPCAKKNWLWWVQIYLRERFMANNIFWILNNYKLKEKPKTLVFLQSFHWLHVKFLMKNPSKNKIWEYYFGQFEEVDQRDIKERVKKHNKIFAKYWDKVSDFR